MPREGRVVVGVITGPHGVKGEARLNSRLVGNLDIKNLRDVYIISPDGITRPARILEVRSGTRSWLVKIEDIDSPEEVREIQGARIEVDAQALPPAEPGEYYWRDLVGLKVETRDGRSLGKVNNLIARGEQDILVIGEGADEILVPAVEPIVAKVDLREGIIVIDPPEGLIEKPGQ